MNITETKQYIRLFIEDNLERKPLAVLVPSFEVKEELCKYLEETDGTRRINGLLTMGAAQYFDTEGNLVKDIASRQQLLADGSKYNAADYLEARAKDYDDPAVYLLYDIVNTYATPDMLGMSRYIANKTGKRLVVIAPIPPKGLETVFSPFETMVCE